MTLDEVKEHFGTFYQVCKALKIAQQNPTRWKQRGYIPLLQQYRIAELTDGALMPDEIDPNISYQQKVKEELKLTK